MLESIGGAWRAGGPRTDGVEGHRRRVRWRQAGWIAAGLSLASSALAADPKEWGGEESAEDERQPELKKPAPPHAAGQTEGTAADDQSPGSAPAPATAAIADTGTAPSPKEESTAKSYLLGVRYRGIFLPAGVLHWFIDGGESVYVNGLGPELAIQGDHSEYVLSAWIASYAMRPAAIKGARDAEEAWEIVQSKMKAVYLTFDYLWHSKLASSLDLSYGAGAGLGFLFGDLLRTQATLAPGGTRGNPKDYVRCTGVSSPSMNYCDDLNDHYGSYGEPDWLHGGAKPLVYPWLTGQLGLRYQASEKFVARLDLGVGTSGLYFGVGADYGL
jgi:hypothetical protein